MKKNIEPEYISSVNKSNNTILHQRKRSEASLSDEWETPQSLYDSLCYKYGVFPVLDICATPENTKCDYYRDKETNGLDILSDYHIESIRPDIWCNPPHNETEEFVRFLCKVWVKWNVNIMAIIPANSICTKYGEECIEPHAEYHPIFFRPKFLQNKKEKDTARNSYFVVIWRKK